MTEELKTLLSREPVRREVPPPPPEWRPRVVDLATLWRELGVEPAPPRGGSRHSLEGAGGGAYVPGAVRPGDDVSRRV
ncbi:hypothetical protein ODS41_09945 [Pyrobaculum sp. 3827-6]|uniref:hypothetical protein n=1 Tax=Pyrobaculum sp. 3827-6 TaxID=2983604 RepID=UPI0021D91F3A|nr:hypothetical protein [Pyrobaculum sp. 3827-6]MCU7788231.1 hypothetical protein [Pyrobaculum sp. 3827-6]